MTSTSLLNTVGTCRECGGTVRNNDSRKGCSKATLEAVHRATCPGLHRKG